MPELHSARTVILLFVQTCSRAGGGEQGRKKGEKQRDTQAPKEQDRRAVFATRKLNEIAK